MATKLNVIFCQCGAQKKKRWGDLHKCLHHHHRHHRGHLPQCLTLHRCSHHLRSRSLPLLSGGDGGIHGPSGPWHRGAGPSLLGHAQPASPLLLVSAADHRTLFFFFFFFEHRQS